MNRRHLKNVFWPKSCVEISFQFLKILQYSCGLKLDLILTLNQNPIFEITSSQIARTINMTQSCRPGTKNLSAGSLAG